MCVLVAILFLIGSAGLDYWPVPQVARLKDPRWDDYIMKVNLVEGFMESLRQGMVRKERVSEEIAEKYASPFNSAEGKKAYLRAARALDYRDTMKIAEDLKNIEIPTIIVWGEEDNFLPVSREKVIQGHKQLKVHNCNNAEHFLPEDDPEIISAIIEGMIQRFLRIIQQMKQIIEIHLSNPIHLMSQMRIAGIDEAGKGPVIGPLVVCGVACSGNMIKKLSEIGVRDSKKLTSDKRKKIAEKLKKMLDWEVVVIHANELDRMMGGKTVNEILKDCCVQIISKLDPDVVYVDSFDVRPERLAGELEKLTGKKVIAKHRAEEEPIVAAASIIAKHTRDDIIEQLKEKYGNFGSGYASDAITRRWLEKKLMSGKIPDIVRKKWKTLDRIKQKSLWDY